jgi:nucleoside-diphosphate-sugar epimerase
VSTRDDRRIQVQGECHHQGVRLLVIGDGWFVGRALVDAAVALGWRVTTFSRTGGGNRPGVEVVHGDRTSTEDLARLATGGEIGYGQADMSGQGPLSQRRRNRSNSAWNFG